MSFIPLQIHASLHSSRPYGVRLNQTGLTVSFAVTWLGYAHFRSAFSILCFTLEKRNVYRNLQIQVHSRSILRMRNCESKLFSSKYHKVAYVSVFSCRNEDKYDIDSYSFCLLATDKEDVNRYKIIKFNPCSKYEETIADQLPYQHDCVMASFEGKVPQFRKCTTFIYSFYRQM